MRTLKLVLMLLVIGSCASKKEEAKFEKEKVCSPLSLNYLKKNKNKRALQSQEVIDEMEKTKPGVQACYEAFAKRSGKHEFDTCLMVGYDKRGKLDFYELSSQQVKLDGKFIKCANQAIGIVPFWKFGKNYVILQSFHFYKD